MRLLIDHRSTYRFAEPQQRLVQMLRMTPQNSHDQTVTDWRIDVDRDARMRTGCDGWGNAVTMLYVEGPLDSIEIAVKGEVLTSHADGVLHGVTEQLPPAVFLRETPATPRDHAIAHWASDLARGGDRLATLHRINAAIGERFTIDPRRSAVPRDAGTVWRDEQATARELAQVFVVAARAIGAPARYVSGYRTASEDNRADPHGWAEVLIEEIGWVGFDPSTRGMPMQHHVRVAVALDATGAAPVAGARMGEGGDGSTST